ncbi:MAG: hypothetical protein KAQ75_09075, partial [Bacteroidales bacterium]|nr:hypothetical protein [Bacteroidales bacterium]
PENIKIYGNSAGILPVSNTEACQDDLINNAIFVEKGSDGIFNSGDYILFYAKDPDQWHYDIDNDFFYCTKHIYSEYNYFFLTTDVGSTNTISNLSPPSGSPVEGVTVFTDYLHHENDKENLIESGQLWFGEHFDITTDYSFEFEFPNLITTSPVKMNITVAARSSINSTFNVKYSGQDIVTPAIAAIDMSSYTSTYALRNFAKGNFLSNSDKFSIDVSYNKPLSSSEAWLDYITLNAERELKMNNEQLSFNCHNNTASSQIIEFRIKNTSSSTKLWNITDPTQAKNLITTNLGSNLISVKVTVAPGLNQFIAFNDDNFYSVELVGNVDNQNLHATNH